MRTDQIRLGITISFVRYQIQADGNQREETEIPRPSKHLGYEILGRGSASGFLVAISDGEADPLGSWYATDCCECPVSVSDNGDTYCKGCYREADPLMGGEVDERDLVSVLRSK